MKIEYVYDYNKGVKTPVAVVVTNGENTASAVCNNNYDAFTKAKARSCAIGRLEKHGDYGVIEVNRQITTDDGTVVPLTEFMRGIAQSHDYPTERRNSEE